VSERRNAESTLKPADHASAGTLDQRTPGEASAL